MAEEGGWAVLPVVKSACPPNSTWTNRNDFGIDGMRLDAQMRICRVWLGSALREVKMLRNRSTVTWLSCHDGPLYDDVERGPLLLQ
jgi:hypothetical protein